MIAQRWHTELDGRLTTWAADPRTTPAMLRQALDDAVACGAFTPSESYTLKAEYPDSSACSTARRTRAVMMPLMRLRTMLRVSGLTN